MTKIATPPKEKKSKPLDLEKVVKQAVLDRLGVPENLSEVRAFNVWGDSWRVNVLCRKESERSCIITNDYTDCFFVTVSPGGEIISSQPEIKRKYNG